MATTDHKGFNQEKNSFIGVSETHIKIIQITNSHKLGIPVFLSPNATA